jgi:hypothetical protein
MVRAAGGGMFAFSYRNQLKDWRDDLNQTEVIVAPGVYWTNLSNRYGRHYTVLDDGGGFAACEMIGVRVGSVAECVRTAIGKMRMNARDKVSVNCL